MVKPCYLVGFTGRRKLSHPEAVRSALAGALKELRDLVDQHGGRLELYSSIAYGADTLAVQEAHKLEIPVHLVLPKPVIRNKQTQVVDLRAGFAADFWDGKPDQGGTFRQRDWDDALEEIERAEKGDNGGTFRLTDGSRSEPECYYDAGLQVLDAADVFLAVLDDQPDRGLGGSKGLVALVDKAKLPLIIIPASGGEVVRHRLDQLAKDGEGRQLLARLEKLSGPAESAGTSEETKVAALFERLDERAARDAHNFRNSMIRAIVCQTVATILAGAAALLPPASAEWMAAITALAAIEFGLIGYALWKTVVLTRKGGLHDRWLLTRFALEIARSLKDSVGLLDPLHPLAAKYQPRWRRFALLAGLAIHRSQPQKEWQQARDTYVQDRLRHPDPRKGQITYFATAYARAEPRFRNAVRWGKRFGTAALVFVMAALAMKCYHYGSQIPDYRPPGPVSVHKDAKTWTRDIIFRFAPIAAPALAGLFLSLRVALDSGRRTYRYNEIADRLRITADTLEGLETESAVRRTVNYTEEVLFDELVEWHLSEQQNGAR